MNQLAIGKPIDLVQDVWTEINPSVLETSKCTFLQTWLDLCMFAEDNTNVWLSYHSDGEDHLPIKGGGVWACSNARLLKNKTFWLKADAATTFYVHVTLGV